MDTGHRIKARRLALGLNAEAVACRCGISPASVYRFENGDIENMRIDKLALLAEALHTSPGYLMGWEELDSSELSRPTDIFALRRLVETAERLTPEGLAKLQDYASDLADHPRYTAPPEPRA